MAEEAEIDTKRFAATGIGRAAVEWQKDLLAALLLAAMALGLYLVPALRGAPIEQTPEVRIAIVAREMLQSGNYTIPTLRGEKRLNKPPLPYWTTAAVAKVLGADDNPASSLMTLAVKAAAALASAFTVFLLVMYGSAAFGRTAGILAGLLMGLSFMAVKFAWKGYGDPTLMAACTAMFCSAAWLLCAPQPGLWAMLALGVSLALATLAKGHIGILLLLGPVILEAFRRREFNGRKILLFVAAVAIGLAITSPWFWIAFKNGAWGSMQYELADTVEPFGHDQEHRWTYYLYKLAGGVVPWTALIACALWACFSDPRKQREASEDIRRDETLQTRFLLSAFCVGFAGFYLFPKQQEHYLLPLLPPLALASGCILSRFNSPGGVAEEKLAWTQLILGAVLGLGMFSLPAWIEHAAQTPDAAAKCRQTIDDFGGWPAIIAAGIALALLHAYQARQWVEGRPMRAVAALAAAAYAVSLAWALHSTSAPPESSSLPALTSKLRQDLKPVAAETRLYCTRMDALLATFYLDRPVRSISELAAEPLGQTGAAAPARMLMGRRDDLEKLNLTNLPPESKPEDVLLISLPPDADWPERFHNLKRNTLRH